MIQLCVASTLYGVATLAAAIDAGQLGTPARRVLLVSNNALHPESQPGPQEQPGFAALARRFDAVESWNTTIAPFHPGQWRPQPADAPLWERLLRSTWGLGDQPLALVLESIQAPPATALAAVFAEAPVTIYSDGLMVYGPTRTPLLPQVSERLAGLLYVELIPGLQPLLASEYGIPSTPIEDAAIIAALAEASEATRLDPGLPTGGALIVGQYLAALGLTTADQERQLYTDLVGDAVALGHRTVVFKPHPTAPQTWSRELADAARAAGADLTVLTTPALAEAVIRRQRPDAVLGCFSTALLTASTLYRTPVAHRGTDLVLDQLVPYPNSNRIPAVLVQALVADLARGEAPRPALPSGAAEQWLQLLVQTVGYCMQPRLDDLREIAVRELREHPQRYARLVPQQRLLRLALPGAAVDLGFAVANPRVRRAARRTLEWSAAMRRRLARLVG